MPPRAEVIELERAEARLVVAQPALAQGSPELAWLLASLESSMALQNVLSVRRRSGPGSASSMRTVCLSSTFTFSGRSILESEL